MAIHRVMTDVRLRPGAGLHSGWHLLRGWSVALRPALLTAVLLVAAPFNQAAAQQAPLAPPASPTRASETTPPDEFVRSLSGNVLEQIRRDRDRLGGDPRRVSTFVDSVVMPHIDFERMTALTVGRTWRQASPEQQARLMAEFRMLLVRTYATALSSVTDQQVRVRPLREAPRDDEVVVRTDIVSSQADPIQLDYRLERRNGEWRIFDLNVLGVWLIEAYRSQFAQEIARGGFEGLIGTLADRNRRALATAGSRGEP